MPSSHEGEAGGDLGEAPGGAVGLLARTGAANDVDGLAPACRDIQLAGLDRQDLTWVGLAAPVWLTEDEHPLRVKLTPVPGFTFRAL